MRIVGYALTLASRTRFIREMRFAAALLILTFLVVSAPGKGVREEPKVIEKVTALPVGLDPNFEFRKTSLFFMSEKGGLKPNERAHDSTSKVGGKSNTPNQKTSRFCGNKWRQGRALVFLLPPTPRLSKVRSDGLIKRGVSESADERFSHARPGLTAWVSGWYRLKE